MSGSLIQGRQTFPIVKFAIVTGLIALLLFLFWFLSKKFFAYKKSEKYINKEKNRLTTYKDVQKFSKENGLSPKYEKILFEVCSAIKQPNILYALNSNSDVIEMFRNAHDYFTAINISDDDLFDIFKLEYKLELIMAKTKDLPSTESIPAQKMILFLSDSGEQLPFYMVKNTPNAMFLEIPEYLYRSPRKPKPYVRQRFIYKTSEGTSYNFVSRIIRYDVSNDNQFLMVVAHTDKLQSSIQRHFKREFVDAKCQISPMHLNQNAKDNENLYTYSDKKYDCRLSNISAGGCCIHTDMPIKENQHLAIIFTDYGIEEKVVGIIKQTRRLQDGNFSLHIQFTKISTKSKNDILRHVYKYEL